MFVKVPADYTTMTTYIGAVCFFFLKMKPNLQWFYGWCVVEDDGSYANKEKTEDGSQIAKSPAHKKIKSKSAAAEADAVVVVQAVVR